MSSDSAAEPADGARRLDPGLVDRLLAGVSAAQEEHRRAWPGPAAGRQPVQVSYVPADRITATTAADQGAEASRLLAAHAGDAATFAEVLGVGDAGLAARIRDRVAAKLETEPVEDLRVDFEDGYLGRDDAQEDADAEAAALAIAAAWTAGRLPPCVGLRVKSFTDGLERRAVATLDRFVRVLLEAGGGLPDGFVVTFPKIVAVGHVAAFVAVLAALEDAHGLPPGRLGFEAQIETTASLLGADGRVVLRDLRAAAAGRLRAAHLGVYDYTAALGLPPEEQRLDHPACDFARHLMQITFAGTEVSLSDGSTNAVPADDSTAEVHRVWRRHAADVRHSLRHGYRQGWDLHPAHLVSRYAAVYAHLIGGLDDVLARLARWHGRDDAVAGVRGVAEEPATVRALTEQVRWAVDCGAITPAEVAERTGFELARRPPRR